MNHQSHIAVVVDARHTECDFFENWQNSETCAQVLVPFAVSPQNRISFFVFELYPTILYLVSIVFHKLWKYREWTIFIETKIICDVIIKLQVEGKKM